MTPREAGSGCLAEYLKAMANDATARRGRREQGGRRCSPLCEESIRSKAAPGMHSVRNSVDNLEWTAVRICPTGPGMCKVTWTDNLAPPRGKQHPCRSERFLEESAR